MPAKIEIKTDNDTRAEVRRAKLAPLSSGKISSLEIVDVYAVDAELAESQLPAVASMLTNPVTQKSSYRKTLVPNDFDWVVEIGFLPGVTDNVGTTAREGIEDLLNAKFGSVQGVFTSQRTFLSGTVSKEDVQRFADTLYNPVIQRVAVKTKDEFLHEADKIVIPRVKLDTLPVADIVNILDLADDELAVIGKSGIANSDGTRRGPLALDITYMKEIQAYFRNKGRNPTDLELESIAQTWSEHCHHTIFADQIDDITDGLFKHYIKRSTNEIRAKKGEKDFCVSVFTDNAGGIIFDERFVVCHKVETHNSPSALDPFGGSITGIVGVNRDPMGFGMGSKPFLNQYGFCFADPNDETIIYKGKNYTQPMLSPRRIMDGVIDGVNVGGNCSGIPTPQGFLFFDQRYKGKPLVFVGTAGLIPRTVNGKPSHEKTAMAGDYIVMVGGKVGKDGIHGATFSSEAMDSGSPATAVQIGDPITQKKESDAIVKEARDLGLYNSITDNGAGGLSCSVAEMAKECGGCYVKLDQVPLKYPGLAPWETWVSESQERMTLSVPKDKWAAFSDLMKRRGVEATIIGEFTDSGKCVVDYNGKNVMDVEMDFLHDGLPERPMKSQATMTFHKEPSLEELDDLTGTLYKMLARQNIASFEFISMQYDHEVQGGSVLKPLQGRGRVNADTTVTRPVLDSNKAVIMSQGINPKYSDIDTYHMAACAIDTAVRNAVAAGANLEHLALLDNFCWCSSNEPERLGQLKNAVMACYDYATAYGTPFVSGKDSMFNDFKGFDADGNPIKISVPPTLLVSSFGVMEDSKKAVSLDAKFAGDLVYVLGETKNELGGSEYFAMHEATGAFVPEVDAEKNLKLYKALSNCISEELVASAQSVHKGGLGVALAKTAMGGLLGMEVCLDNLSGMFWRDDCTLYSESQGRIVVTVAPENKDKFEKLMEGNFFARVGVVKEDKSFVVKSAHKVVINGDVDEMLKSYKSTFAGY